MQNEDPDSNPVRPGLVPHLAPKCQMSHKTTSPLILTFKLLNMAKLSTYVVTEVD